MKTTALILSVFALSLAFAQTPKTQTAQTTPTPPVPGSDSTMKDMTGSAVGTPNENIIEAENGAIKKARVYFVEPKDGATVGPSVKVKMAVEGAKLRPAGEAPDDMTSGHFHIVIDGKPTPAGQVLPTNKNTLHFGKAETETTLSLAPGTHTLVLQFGDGAHRAFGPKMSQTIKVHVK